jgi:thiol:disulfide interchange protein DsbD
MTRYLLPLIALALAAGPARAQEFDDPGAKPKRFADAVAATLTVDPTQAKPGETVTVKLTLTPRAGWHTYPFNPPPGQASKNDWAPAKGGPLVFQPFADPPAKPNPEAKGEVYYDGTVTWEIKATVAADAAPGPATVTLGETQLQVCKEQCLNSRERDLPTAAFIVLPGDRSSPPPAAVPPKAEVASKPSTEPAVKPAESSAADGVGRKPAKPTDEYTRDLAAVAGKLDHAGAVTVTGGPQDLTAFLVSAAAFGLISLVTPCVFPMIPITVSIFLKQAQGSLRERLKLSGVYCLTIITVLGLSAFALLRFMAWLSTQPATNVFLGVLFVVLALSLFGMYELTLPNFMVRRLQAKQAKGGVIGTVFGALAFTVISFTCVAPFLGGFTGIAQANQETSLIAVPTTREIFGGLVFATAFAAPFFVLSLVPGLLRSLPRSGGWLDSVKVVMGFLEVAAALKFFRAAEIAVSTPTTYFTYDVVIAGWVAISVACGLYLLNVYRLPHDEERPNIGVVRLLFAVSFLGLGLYLLPALFKGPDGKANRPAGAVYAWIEAFLLPETRPEVGTDLKAALDRSRARAAAGAAPRPVFVDFTGVTCTNCEYNESQVFTRPEVRKLLDQFDTVRLYTDVVPDEYFAVPPDRAARKREARANQDFEADTFGTVTLPTYVVLLPTTDGKVRVLGKYDLGKINDPAAFARFLSQTLEMAKGK